QTIEKGSDKVSFFKKDTLQEIINEVLLKNKYPKNLNVEILDFDGVSLLKVEVLDSLYDCKNVKAFYNYNNTTLIFIDYSENVDYEDIVNLNSSLSLDLCDKLVMKETGFIIDPKTYTYRIDNKGRISYPNG